MRKIEAVKSICPECRKTIEADIIEENGSVYMVKTCPEHGEKKALISKYAWYYQGLNSLYQNLFPRGHALTRQNVKNIQVHLTARCNLSCTICYSHKDKEEKEYSFDEIKSLVGNIKGRKTVGLLGGEPTERQDLFLIIRELKKSGHTVALYTNGLRLGDSAYVAKLKKAGVGIFFLGLDTLTDDTVYRSLRGRTLIAEKQAALRNLMNLHCRTGFVSVVARNINEHCLPELVEYACRNDFVAELSLRGYSHFGKKGLSTQGEFTIDELVDELSRQSRQLVTIEEFYMFQRLVYAMRSLRGNNPQCYVRQHMYLPRNKALKMRDIFHPDKFNRYLDIFAQMYPDSPLAAKKFLLTRIAHAACRHPWFFCQRALSDIVPRFYRKFYFLLEITTFYNPYTLDLNKTATRCSDAWLPSFAEGKLVDYCTLLCDEY